MDPIKADFLIVKVEENIWDVVIFAEDAVLEAFASIFHAQHIPESVFDKKPVAILPNFEESEHAEVWKQYWMDAFADPENACLSCTTVNELFQRIAEGRQKKAGNDLTSRQSPDHM